ncbi:hypothetical protein [Streptomyces collinus]|uniref:Uncharacterized protein n=1 Tax=Streptomyces collinus TaxID=42684 RepID=A0AA89QEW3_STRCU|nr:hypothetical protein [Streptomyces collinus]MBB5815616.1 hypothetical protein [Streptomyces collinus]WMX68520.1 hypothetical protein RFN52_36355 [Streptomyces collinus]
MSPQRPAGERAAGAHLDLLGAQARNLAGQVGEALRAARGAEDLGDAVGLLPGEPEHRPGFVGIVAGIHHRLEVP